MAAEAQADPQHRQEDRFDLDGAIVERLVGMSPGVAVIAQRLQVVRLDGPVHLRGDRPRLPETGGGWRWLAARRAAGDSAPPRAARRGRVMNPPKTKPSVDWHASISGAALSVCRQSDASDDPSVAEAYARFQVSSCDVSGRCDHREHRCATVMKVRRPCISTSGPPSPPASAGAVSAATVGAGRRSASAAAARGIIAGRPPKRH